MPRMIFVNLPVSDIAAATRFYSAIGFTQNPQFSDHQASAMVFSESVTFMLLSRQYFATFAPAGVVEKGAGNEVLLALSCETSAAVDEVLEAGAAAGGTPDVRPPEDHGFMRQRTLLDPDGHVFEISWMDPDATFAEGEMPA